MGLKPFKKFSKGLFALAVVASIVLASLPVQAQVSSGMSHGVSFSAASDAYAVLPISHKADQRLCAAKPAKTEIRGTRLFLQERNTSYRFYYGYDSDIRQFRNAAVPLRIFGKALHQAYLLLDLPPPSF